MEPAQIGILIVAFIILAICLGGLLVCREIVCWYFKFSQMSSKMDEVNQNLAGIRKDLARQRQNP